MAPRCPRHRQTPQDLFLLRWPPEGNRRVPLPASPQPFPVCLSTGSVLGLLPPRSTGRGPNAPRAGAGVAARQSPGAAGGWSPFTHISLSPGTREPREFRSSARPELTERGWSGMLKAQELQPQPRGHRDSGSQPHGGPALPSGLYGDGGNLWGSYSVLSVPEQSPEDSWVPGVRKPQQGPPSAAGSGLRTRGWGCTRQEQGWGRLPAHTCPKSRHFPASASPGDSRSCAKSASAVPSAAPPSSPPQEVP